VAPALEGVADDDVDVDDKGGILLLRHSSRHLGGGDKKKITLVNRN
jgi:hypothetical protein